MAVCSVSLLLHSPTNRLHSPGHRGDFADHEVQVGLFLASRSQTTVTGPWDGQEVQTVFRIFIWGFSQFHLGEEGLYLYLWFWSV